MFIWDVLHELCLPSIAPRNPGSSSGCPSWSSMKKQSLSEIVRRWPPGKVARAVGAAPARSWFINLVSTTPPNIAITAPWDFSQVARVTRVEATLVYMKRVTIHFCQGCFGRSRCFSNSVLSRSASSRRPAGFSRKSSAPASFAISGKSS